MAITLPIYLDNAATTKLDPRVLDAMMPYLTEIYGNPASRSHSFGWSAESGVENAREEIAAALGCDSKEIIFTSGATESSNLAIKGAALFYQEKGKHIISTKIEHKATLDTLRSLERIGFEVTYVSPESNGLISAEKFSAAIRDDTILASIHYVHNEIGVIQDIEAIGKICNENDILLHVDGVQAVGKIPVDTSKLSIALMSVSAHKVYGPKGIGALYVRRKPRVRLLPLIDGGGHERGFRSGTLPTHQIVGMGKAFQIATNELEIDCARILELRTKLITGLENIPEVYINGDMKHRIPHNLNISFNYIEGESLIMAIKDIAVSSGSACTSSSLEPSYVLRALGLNDELAHSSIRFSIGRFNTMEEIDYTINLIQQKVAKLRNMSPLWEMFSAGIDIENFPWGKQSEHRDIILHN